MGACLGILAAAAAQQPLSGHSSLDPPPSAAETQRRLAATDSRGTPVLGTALLGTALLQEELFQAQMQLALLQSLSDAQSDNAGAPRSPQPPPTNGAKLSKAEVLLLPVTKYGQEVRSTELDAEDSDSDPECSICWGSFKTGESITRLPCNMGHKFHHKCITEWLVCKSALCPMCRGDVKLALTPTAKRKKKDTEGEEAKEAGDDRLAHPTPEYGIGVETWRLAMEARVIRAAKMAKESKAAAAAGTASATIVNVAITRSVTKLTLLGNRNKRKVEPMPPVKRVYDPLVPEDMAAEMMELIIGEVEEIAAGELQEELKEAAQAEKRAAAAAKAANPPPVVVKKKMQIWTNLFGSPTTSPTFENIKDVSNCCDEDLGSRPTSAGSDRPSERDAEVGAGKRKGGGLFKIRENTTAKVVAPMPPKAVAPKIMDPPAMALAVTV